MSARVTTRVVHACATAVAALALLGASSGPWQIFRAPVRQPLGALTLAADGSVWATSDFPNGLFHVARDGTTTFQRLVDIGGDGPAGIVLGPDRRLWMVSRNPYLMYAYAPQTRELSIYQSTSKTDQIQPGSILAGSDGNVWFAEYNHIADMTPTGTMTERGAELIPKGGFFGGSLAQTPDGKIWFTYLPHNAFAERIGSIDPLTREIRHARLPSSLGTYALQLTAGRDGFVYGAATNNTGPGTVFFRFDPTTSETTLYRPVVVSVYGLAAGPPGTLYVGSGYPNDLCSFDLGSGILTFHYTPNGDGVGPLVVGADGILRVIMGPKPALGLYDPRRETRKVRRQEGRLP